MKGVVSDGGRERKKINIELGEGKKVKDALEKVGLGYANRVILVNGLASGEGRILKDKDRVAVVFPMTGG